jgi:hypothetical protein
VDDHVERWEDVAAQDFTVLRSVTALCPVRRNNLQVTGHSPRCQLREIARRLLPRKNTLCRSFEDPLALARVDVALGVFFGRYKQIRESPSSYMVVATQ